MLRNVPDATRVAAELAAVVAARGSDVRTNAAVSPSTSPGRRQESRDLEQAGALA